MRRRVRGPKKPRPAREEWDFRPRGITDWYDDRKYGHYDFLDENEVFFCLCYEIDRHGPDAPSIVADRDHPVRRVEVVPQTGALPKFKEERLSPCLGWIEWKQRCKDWAELSFDEQLLLRQKTFDALLNQHLRLSPDHCVFREWFYIPWPEWPAMPYLSIPSSERRLRLQKSWEKYPKRALKLVCMLDIIKGVRALKQGKTYPGLQYWIHGNDLKMNEDIWVLRPRFSPEQDKAPTEIVAFAIDFNLSPKTLTQLFNNWVVQRRKLMGYKHRENRGPASQAGRLRSQLMALGARRLLDTGMTYREAADYTKALTGRPLFAGESEWSDALRSEVIF